jgi:hypothetical protein
MALLGLTALVLLAGIAPALGVARAAPPAQGDQPPQRSGRVLLNPGGYLTAPASGDPLDIALAYIQRQRAELGLGADDLADIEVTDRYTSADSGLTHIYLRQRLAGIPVAHAAINASLAADGRILNVGSGFVSDLARKAGAAAPSLTAAQAVEHVAADLGMKLGAAVVPLAAASGADSATQLSDGGISRAPIPASLIYVPVSAGELRLSWRLVIDAADGSDWFEAYADAENGALLDRISYGDHPARAAAGPATARPAAPPLRPALAAPAAGVADGSSYRVFPFPIDSPFDDGDAYNDERQTLGNPADATASPYGWHDTNGQAGAEYTITRGNNVHAYEDRAQANASAGDEPDGGPGLDFAPPLSLGPAIDPVGYDKASTVQLFYANNYIHDVLSRNGFDEVAGNFQATNYGGTGAGNDAVSAEAQDGGGLVNANFATPPDGQAGRMQMYLGDAALRLSITVSAPAGISIATAGGANFGPQSFAISGDLALADDGTAPTGDSCQTIVNNIAGKIALIDRGNCSFEAKAKNAQAAGAIGVVFVDNTASTTPPPIGKDNTVVDPTIPILAVTQAAGGQLKTALGGGTVSLSMARSLTTNTDGALDNGVIAHEYAHGLSTRLTGGPADSGCLSNVEQEGEGWSDFLALVLTARPGDTAATPRALGNYLLNTQGSAQGIRYSPYSTDLGVNPQTYRSISDQSLISQIGASYAVGTTWSSMLWEVYWNLVAAHGFSADLTSGDSGNRLALRLAIAGMKIQPCNPSMIEARDAIVQADVALNGGANICRIWEGFAKRGLGYSASGQDPTKVGDEVEAYDLPSSCTVSIKPAVLNVCAPDNAVFSVASGPSTGGAAALAVRRAPRGTSAGLGSASIGVEGQTSLTIAGTGGAAVGSYTVSVTATVGAAVYTPTATLNIANQLAAAPALLNPAADGQGVALLPTFSWQAAAQAVRYRFELADEPGFAQPLVDTELGGTSYSLPSSLKAGRSYYWRVRASNGCGVGAPAPVRSFMVGVAPRVLLVDDDTNDPVDVAASYAGALQALGVSYTTWSTGNGTAEPAAAYLANFQTIIWAGGQGQNSSVTAAGEAELSQVMGNGRCLLLSTPDYFARRGLTSFMQTYMGLASAIDDPGQRQLTGAGLLAGLGPYAIGPNLTNNYTDALTADSTAQAILSGDAGTAAIAKDGGSYRSAYFGVSLDGLGSAGQKAVLAAMLGWCDIPRDDLSLVRAGGPATALLPGQPFTVTLRLDNLGPKAAASPTLSLTLPSGVTAVQVSGAGLGLTPLAGQPNRYSLASLAAGAGGTLTITGKVSPSLSAAGTGPIGATMASATIDADSSNDSFQGLLTFTVPRLGFVAATAYANPGGRAATLRVVLDRANPYAPATASYALVSGSPAGVDLGSGALSVPAGATSATISLTLSAEAARLGQRSLVLGLSGPAGAAIGTFAQTTLGGPAVVYLPMALR